MIPVSLSVPLVVFGIDASYGSFQAASQLVVIAEFLLA
jgi:hypothetical protein